ncbi:hypothetical protein [Castellaniella defragrans]|uniref:Glucose-6-phosphate isomerase n=1 Tax=Castellaniella defragrans TaxID=75697 RepID=A0A7W9TNQ6_CASDE|nr:hypothetical protein [Castellaniella defragrans]MBB6083022.1 glucose-6-phosphate isomerase/transaldolase/glucose-6-phosphate isomerase [Castellaniella defragrans]
MMQSLIDRAAREAGPAPHPRLAPLYSSASRLAPALNRLRMVLPQDLHERLTERMRRLDGAHWSARFWRGDASLWSGGDEAGWLGWTDPARLAAVAHRSLGLCARLRSRGRTDAVLLGMGGASLGAQVLASVLAPAQGGLRLHVLDSTNPEQVRSLQARVPVAHCLYLVASKSGGTLESTLLAQHFEDHVARVEGRQRVGQRFCAITDPGTPLHARAEAGGYAAVFLGDPRIGGRYSVLSPFGMVPLALMGHDPIAFLREAGTMRDFCGPRAHGHANVGLRLGALLGEAALMGRDKITFWADEELAPLAEWLEQLLAESTGKQGRGLVPVCGEPPGPPCRYGSDRLFVVLQGPGSPARGDERTRLGRELARAGHPVVHVRIATPYALAQEFYRWQYATAVAGHVLGVNPFDQPDVEASKQRTRGLLARGAEPADRPAGQRWGSLLLDVGASEAGAGGAGADDVRASEPAVGDVGATDGGATDGGAGDVGTRDAAARDAGARGAADSPAGPEQALARWLRRGPGGYHALLFYLPRTAGTQAWLSRWQQKLRDAGGGAVTAAFGPRYLHSCGQLHKGGPACGAYLFVRMAARADGTDGASEPLAACHAAQAEADLRELRARGRACVSVRFGASLEQGLQDLSRLLEGALAQAAGLGGPDGPDRPDRPGSTARAAPASLPREARGRAEAGALA